MLAAPLSLFGELERSAVGVLYSSLLRHRRFFSASRAGGAASCAPGGRLPSCFFVDDDSSSVGLRGVLDTPSTCDRRRATPVAALALPRGEAAEADGEPAFKPRAQGGCSPKTMQLRYPDGLAHGAVARRHSNNCRSELEALGWWTRGGVGDPCVARRFRNTIKLLHNDQISAPAKQRKEQIGIQVAAAAARPRGW